MHSFVAVLTAPIRVPTCSDIRVDLLWLSSSASFAAESSLAAAEVGEDLLHVGADQVRSYLELFLSVFEIAVGFGEFLNALLELSGDPEEALS